MPRASLAHALAALLSFLVAAGPAAAQEPEAAVDAPKAEAPREAPKAARPKPKPAPKRPPRPEAPPPAEGASKASQPDAKAAPLPPALPLASYVEAATTTIIAEQTCPGIRLNAGQLTSLRLSARVAAAQEAALEEQLRARSVEVRRQLAADGREAWCAEALAAFGPQGTVARGILAPGAPVR